MILYDNGGVLFVWNLSRVHGSVFPKALLIAIPSSAMSIAFVHFLHTGNYIEHFKDDESVMSNNAIWGGFSFAVGFLVIFRTSQAYSRFWEGCTNMHKMGVEWYDACASLIAFTKHSERPKHEILKFQNMLIRLFSMVHAAACGEIEESGMGYDNISTRIGAFDMELIDPHSVNDESLLAVQSSDMKTEMIMQWIQQFIVESIKPGILTIPPPILSRSFQELATGMVHFNEAMKIAHVPFPFPYAQTCDALLVLHWCVVPFIISQWVMKPWWAGVFAFVLVFTLWSLDFIAMELENPFGCDANDIDGREMQRAMNSQLRTLIREETLLTPKLKSESQCEEQEAMEQELMRSKALQNEHSCCESFARVWAGLHRDELDSSGAQSQAIIASGFRLRSQKSVKTSRKSAVKDLRSAGIAMSHTLSNFSMTDASQMKKQLKDGGASIGTTSMQSALQSAKLEVVSQPSFFSLAGQSAPATSSWQSGRSGIPSALPGVPSAKLGTAEANPSDGDHAGASCLQLSDKVPAERKIYDITIGASQAPNLDGVVDKLEEHDTAKDFDDAFLLGNQSASPPLIEDRKSLIELRPWLDKFASTASKSRSSLSASTKRGTDT